MALCFVRERGELSILFASALSVRSTTRFAPAALLPVKECGCCRQEARWSPIWPEESRSFAASFAGLNRSLNITECSGTCRLFTITRRLAIQRITEYELRNGFDLQSTFAPLT